MTCKPCGEDPPIKSNFEPGHSIKGSYFVMGDNRDSSFWWGIQWHSGACFNVGQRRVT